MAVLGRKVRRPGSCQRWPDIWGSPAGYFQCVVPAGRALPGTLSRGGPRKRVKGEDASWGSEPAQWMPSAVRAQAKPPAPRVHSSPSPASGKGWLTKGTLAPRRGKEESLDQRADSRGHCSALSCSNWTPRAPCWSPGGGRPPAQYESMAPLPPSAPAGAPGSPLSPWLAPWGHFVPLVQTHSSPHLHSAPRAPPSSLLTMKEGDTSPQLPPPGKGLPLDGETRAARGQPLGGYKAQENHGL